MAKQNLIVRPGAYNALFAAEMARDPALRDFLTTLNQYPLLSRADELRLGALAHAGDRAAREALVNHNLKLVVTISKRFIGQGLPLADLIQEGVIGLMDAVAHYEPRERNRFCSYAGWWITQAMSRALINTGTMIRLPVYLAELRTKLHRFIARYEEQHGHAPTLAEMRLATGAKAQAIEDALTLTGMTHSLDVASETENESGTASLLDTLADNTPPVETTLLVNEQYAELYQALAVTLDHTETLVVAYRYGLGGLGRDPHDYVADAGDDVGATPKLGRAGAKRYLTTTEKNKRDVSATKLSTETSTETGTRASAVGRAPLTRDGLMEYKAIGLILGLSPEKVQRTEVRALRKLRQVYDATTLLRLLVA